MQTKLFILAGEGLAKLETFMTSAVQTGDNIGGKQNRNVYKLRHQLTVEGGRAVGARGRPPPHHQQHFRFRLSGAADCTIYSWNKNQKLVIHFENLDYLNYFLLLELIT